MLLLRLINGASARDDGQVLRRLRHVPTLRIIRARAFAGRLGATLAAGLMGRIEGLVAVISELLINGEIRNRIDRTCAITRLISNLIGGVLNTYARLNVDLNVSRRCLYVTMSGPIMENITDLPLDLINEIRLNA